MILTYLTDEEVNVKLVRPFLLVSSLSIVVGNLKHKRDLGGGSGFQKSI